MANVISAVSGFTSGCVLGFFSFTGGYIGGRVMYQKIMRKSGKLFYELGGAGLGAFLLSNLDDSLFSTSIKIGVITASTLLASTSRTSNCPKNIEINLANKSRIVGLGVAALGTLTIGPITGLCIGVLTTAHLKDAMKFMCRRQEDLIYGAIFENNIEEILQLIKKDADIVNAAIDENDASPLHYASFFGSSQIGRLLLNNNAPLGAIDKDSQTPLHYACDTDFDSTQIATLLIDNDAPLELADKKGNTPLHLACLNGKTKIVKILIEKKVPLNDQNNDGKTPCELATNHPEIVKMIEKELIFNGAMDYLHKARDFFSDPTVRKAMLVRLMRSFTEEKR